MEKIVFECESITPIFMYGADGKTPELRPASIKGLMRFWWRAIYGDLPLKDLKEKEDEIFGNTEKRSNLIIYPVEIIKEDNFKISLTPHHREGYCSENNPDKNCYFKYGKCMKANQREAKLYKFKVTFSLKENKYLSKEQLIELFKITTLLGGFGQRSRRGFGSVRIIGDDALASLENIESFVDEISKYQKSKPKNKQYPYIRKIDIGDTPYNSYLDLLKKIGEETHKNRCGKSIFFKDSRMASPIYVSVLKISNNDYRAIIATLNCVSETNINLKNFILKQKTFKEAIL